VSTRRLVLAFAPLTWVAFVAVVGACGSRTGLLAPGPDRAVVDAGADVADGFELDVLPSIDVFEPEGPDECPDAGSTLVYLITQQNVLMSFYPPTGGFNSIGTIACPDPQGGTPFSMAVDRKGIAYVVFDDGNLFRVSTRTAACQATSYFPGQSGFPVTFGMGYSADTNDSGETLYLAGTPTDPNTGMPTGPAMLGSLDTTSFNITTVGTFNPPIVQPELTGTGSGQLFGFWAPDIMSDSSIVQIDRVTAADTSVVTLPGVVLGGGWAFGFWGGDFYVFTTPGGLGTASLVTRYRPSDGSITPVATAPDGLTIVGAGVSTCAPQM
jgi:hypothetical protein